MQSLKIRSKGYSDINYNRRNDNPLRNQLTMYKLITLSLLLVALAGCQPNQVALTSDLSVGDAFPALSGTDINGDPISISEFKGKVILLDFFGDW